MATESVVPSPEVKSLIDASRLVNGVKLVPDRAFEKEKPDRQTVKELTQQLLEMSTKNLSMQVNSHNYDKKKPITIAQELSDGTTLEYEYTTDNRVKDTYRLTTITLVRGNAQTIKLIDDPVTDDNSEMRQVVKLWTVQQRQNGDRNVIVETTPLDKTIDARFKTLGGQAPEELPTDFLQGLAPSDQKKISEAYGQLREVKVPLLITGSVLKEFNRWLPRLEFIKTSLMRQWKGNSTAYIYFHYVSHKGTDILINSTQKVGAKLLLYAVLFAAIYFISHDEAKVHGMGSGSMFRRAMLQAASQDPKIKGLHLPDMAAREYEATFDKLDKKETDSPEGHRYDQILMAPEGLTYMHYFKSSEAIVIYKPGQPESPVQVTKRADNPQEFERELTFMKISATKISAGP